MRPFLNYPSEFEDAQFVVVPVPMELSTSFGKGANKGPEAILDASCEVEIYDIELGCEPIEDFGISLADTIRPESLDAKDHIDEIAESVNKIVSASKIPVVLGGEHSLSYGVFLGLKNKYKNVSILHLDAHTDLRNDYFGSKYSHASVIRRIYEHKNEFKSIVSAGIRSVSKEEINFIKEVNYPVYYAQRTLSEETMDKIVSHLGDTLYITLDIDVLDPSIIPSTGTPEPGGMQWYDLLALLKKAITGRKLVAVDLVEVAPDNINHHTQFTAAKILYKIMGYAVKYGRV